MQEYSVDSGVIVTPSARSWLLENKIDLVVNGKCISRAGKPKRDTGKPQRGVRKSSETEALEITTPPRYKLLADCPDGVKPEHMTALRGTTLVCKTHAIIGLRGKLDSLIARIIEAQLIFKRLGLIKGIDDLGETADYVRKLMRAEVHGEQFDSVCLFGMDDTELRDRSHKPKKYYDMPHFFASVEDGEAVVLLNSLRTASREVELEACRAFETKDGESERLDIIRALNRLSSAYYVMMFKIKAGEYE